MSETIWWEWREFGELSVDELYQLMKLRQEVFVVEQSCVYLDADGHDPQCIHGLAFTTDTKALVAHARIVPPGLTFETPSIGRVVVATTQRSTGLGHELMRQAIEQTTSRYPGLVVTIGAQLYLQRFYEGHGFVAFDEPYDEDGIMHVHMSRTPSDHRADAGD